MVVVRGQQAGDAPADDPVADDDDAQRPSGGSSSCRHPPCWGGVPPLPRTRNAPATAAAIANAPSTLRRTFTSGSTAGRTGIEAGTYASLAKHVIGCGRRTSGERTRATATAGAKNPLTSTSLGQSTGSVWPADERSVPMAALKRILIGRPISSADEHHQRLSKKVALPVFASDAISSTAYATDEILVVLLLQAGIGAAAFDSAGADRDRRLRAAGDRGDLVPPDDHGLPVGRRRLHREPREPGRHAVARRRVGAAGRLHLDGVGQRRRRCAGDPHGNRLRHPVDRAGVPARVCSSSP